MLLLLLLLLPPPPLLLDPRFFFEFHMLLLLDGADRFLPLLRDAAVAVDDFFFVPAIKTERERQTEIG